MANNEKREKDDFYPTPEALIRDTLRRLTSLINFSPRRILDPGCGNGPWGKVARDFWPDAHIIGIDIYPGSNSAYDKILHADFLQTDGLSDFDMVIGNPPYKFAEEFVRKSLASIREHGLLIQLLRAAFYHGKRRANNLYQEYPLWHYWPLAQRPSFIPLGMAKAGHTEHAEYAIFAWMKGYLGSTTADILRWDNKSTDALAVSDRPQVDANGNVKFSGDDHSPTQLTLLED